MTPAKAEKWVNSPLRNSIKLELNAPVNEVWLIAGDPAKIFSNCCGVIKVDTKMDDSRKCTEYTITYASEDGSADMVMNTTMVWYEHDLGWAAIDDEPNAMRFTQSLILINVEQHGNKTILNWNMHYNIEGDEVLQMFITGLEQSLKNEIAPLFIQKFGGKVL